MPNGRWTSVVTVGGTELPGPGLAALGADGDAVDDEISLALVAGGVDDAGLLDEGLALVDRALGAATPVRLVEGCGAVGHVDDHRPAVGVPAAGAAGMDGQLEDLNLGVGRGLDLRGGRQRCLGQELARKLLGITALVRSEQREG